MVFCAIFVSQHDCLQHHAKKVNKTITCCSKLIHATAPTITQIAEIIGILVSNLPGVDYGQLHYRSLELDKNLALKTSQGNYNCHMKISNKCTKDLGWWVENMQNSNKPILRPNPSTIIKSASSKRGWGAVKGSLKTGGRWSTVECLSHTNYLELLAALFALKALCTGLGGTHIKLQLDNTTAVAYINNMGVQNLLSLMTYPFRYGNGASSIPCGSLQCILKENQTLRLMKNPALFVTSMSTSSIKQPLNLF